MVSVELKVKGKEVKIVSENDFVFHVFKCEDLSVQGLLSKLKKEIKEYDLENYYVEDIKFL